MLQYPVTVSPLTISAMFRHPLCDLDSLKPEQTHAHQLRLQCHVVGAQILVWMFLTLKTLPIDINTG